MSSSDRKSGKLRKKDREADAVIYNDSVFENSSEDVAALRKQVLMLSRRMMAIEQDNQLRVKRENYFIYSLASLSLLSLWLFLRR